MSNTDVTYISTEQTELVLRFLDSLFSEDLEGYWECISKVDQARVYGMYRAAIVTGAEDCSFYDYVNNHFKQRQVGIYEQFKVNPGISNVVRYTDDGEVKLYVLKDIQVPIHIIAETQMEGIPVVLTLDTEVNNGKVYASWKIRLFEDNTHKNLFSELVLD